MDLWSEASRIFLGDARDGGMLFLLEIVFRTTVMYLYTIFLARMVGHDAIGQIGPFEFVLVIAVGSAAGDPMFYPEIGLLQGILVITVVIVLHRLTGALLQRSKRIESMVEGDPVLVIRNGSIENEGLGSGSLTERELLALLRVEGIRDVSEVESAFFENNGRLSVFRYPGSAKRRKTQSTMPKVVGTA